MTSDITTAPRAWRAATLDPPQRWYYDLSSAAVEALARRARDPRPAVELRPDRELAQVCDADLRPVREALEQGRGFAIVRGFPIERGSAEATAAYWLVGHLLGEPFAQNVQGTRLYDVRDAGGDLTQGARFSVTNYESSFHTDNCFGDSILDYVGLLCLKTARSGGVSQMANGFAVWDVLGREAPDTLDTLQKPFHMDRRGGVRPGEAPTVAFPVVERRGDELLFRYLRYWVQAGHDKAGQPLTLAQTAALDALDAVLARPELGVQFRLRPGDMYFLNNRWLLHNRTAFEDHAEPERKRHLVRLWLRRTS